MSIFDQFTNQYELSKTLRFELRPIPPTLENMKNHLGYNKEFQTFLKDQEIENAYQTLKPKIDKIHETFITDSLESEKAMEIDFSEYPETYKNRKDEWEKFKKQESALRTKIGETYAEGGKKLKEKYPDLKWKKGSSEAKGPNMLSSPDILEAVRKDYSKDKEKEIEKILDETFKGFFTYFSGFNTNRANYYTSDQKATGIANRIININLNIFIKNKDDFDRSYF